jgi:hypothetical protein
MGSFAMYPGPQETAPLLVYAIGMTVWGLFLWKALERSRRGVRMSVTFVTIVAAVIPVGLTLVSYHRLGLFWQGRYSLPLLVGVALMLGYAIDESGTRIHRYAAQVTMLCVWTMITLSLVMIVDDYLPYQANLPGWQIPNSPVWILFVSSGSLAVLGGIISHPRNVRGTGRQRLPLSRVRPVPGSGKRRTAQAKG